jgi:hypothetical protein
MRNLVIAPTSTYKRGPLRKEVNDTIKDYVDAAVIEQRVDSIMPLNCDKSKSVVEQRIYQDMKSIHYLHERNRKRDLEVYDRDKLFETRPMYNVSFPEMKLRKQS